jgi:uncharacterized damage-inducible protein DinB
MIIDYCLNDLEELKSLLEAITKEVYTLKIHTLSGSSMGEHTRHILEFYGCVLFTEQPDLVNYDSRKRVKAYQDDPTQAIAFIDQMIERLESDISDKDILLTNDFSLLGNNGETYRTSIYRELAYCVEHSVHHKALIRIGLGETGMEHLIGSGFGIAPSTIRSRSEINNI